MKIEQVTVTPEMARDWLNMNTDNRPLRDSTVRTLMAAIRRGEWKLTHQPIAIDEAGRVLDGQHRLQACVLSGKSLPMMVAREAPRATFDVIDIGARRSLADILRLPPLQAAALGYVCRLVWTNEKMSPQMAERIWPFIEKPITALTNEVSKNRRFVTTGAVMSAAAIRLAGGEPPQYVLSLWRALVMMNMDDLPPVAQAFVRRVLDSKANTRTAANAHQQFANAWIMFNSDNEDKDRFRADSENAIIEARGTMYAVMGIAIPELNTVNKRAGR